MGKVVLELCFFYSYQLQKQVYVQQVSLKIWIIKQLW